MLHTRSLPILSLATFLGLSACDGGNGGPPPQQPNQPPSFTSAASTTVPENSGGTIYTATATDPDGDGLTFSLAGGADQAAFRITAAGALSFAAAPDFEAPADADGNNIYLVSLGLSDGTTSDTLGLTVTVTDTGPDEFAVTRVGAGFSQPLLVAPVPDGSGRVFVVQKTGLIRILDPDTGAIAPRPFLNVSGEVSTNSERGLLGLATAPDFATSGVFYVNLTNLAGDTEIRRYRTLAADRNRTDPASADMILRFEQPFANHNGGWIDFGPDGFLYIGSGDGGGGGDPQNNGQNSNVLLGKILRIDVSGDSFPNDPARDYRIPGDNPFAGGGGRGEVWALGLRNPFRASFDPVTRNLLIGDVGQNAVEEIDLMRPGDGGANFGWSIVEGTQPFKGNPQPSFVPPVAEYLHGTGPRQGNSVTGGYVYRGPVEALRGHYVFGDFVAGAIWSVPLSRLAIGSTLPSSQFTIRTQQFAPDAGAINSISSFGIDESNNLYIVDFDGEIFRVDPR